MEIKITSTAFEEGGMIPEKYTCDGIDVSPPIAWSSVPDGTKTLALICDDPDAPMGTWVHWFLFNLPASTNELPGNMPTDEELENGVKQGRNDFRKKPNTIEIYHLERIANILDTPENYGIRLEFLDIELTKEEQLSFFATRDQKLFQLSEKLEMLMTDYNAFKKSLKYDESAEIFKERTAEEIHSIIDEFKDKIWYDRHQLLKRMVEKKQSKVDPKIWKGALQAEKMLEEKYGIENLGPRGDFE